MEEKKSKKKKRVRKDRSKITSLSERHIISEKHPFYKECDELCFLSKNLYNATLFVQRQSFFDKNFRNYHSVNREFTMDNQIDYRALPAKVAKQTQMLVQQNFSSFFALLEKSAKGEYDKRVQIPRYLKKDGRQVINYEKGALSLKKEGFIKLSKTGIEIKTKIPKEQITNVRIVPKGNHYVIEVLYDVPKVKIKKNDFSRVAFIDPGMNNLMTVTSNVFHPLIYNGRVAKSINQLYNKERAKKQSRLSRKKLTVLVSTKSKIDDLLNPKQLKQSKTLDNITNRRNLRIHDLFHKITTHLVNYLVANNIRTVIFGHNVGQKQNINMGAKTNQNFVGLPFTKLISMLEYKCGLKGIRFIVTEESHTSKCSFIDKEEVCHHENYVGKRVKRGLFKTKNGILINADINGSLNIGRKYMQSQKKYTNKIHNQLLKFMSNPKIVNVKFD